MRTHRHDAIRPTGPLITEPPEPAHDCKAFRPRLCLIIIAAAFLRIILLAYAESNPARFDFPDSHRYLLVARNIAAGHGPIDSNEVRAGTDPLYPLILSAGVRLGIEDEAGLMRFGRVVNCLFGLVSVALLALLARRLLGDRPALIASAILAVDPILLFFNALVLTETPYAALLLAAFYCLARSHDRRAALAPSRAVDGPARWAAASGLLLGLATLMRSSSILLPVLFLPLVCAAGARIPPALDVAQRCQGSRTNSSGNPLPCPPLCPPRSRASRCFCVAAVFLIAYAAVLVPTTARNYHLFGHFIPVRSGGGASLMEALGPWADGAPGMDRIQYPAFAPDADEYQRDLLCRAAAWRWACNYPGKALSLAWAKLRRTWSITINATEYASPLADAIAWLTVAPEFALILAGIWLLRRQPAILLLLLIPTVYFTLVHMIFVGSVRYRIPAMPMLLILAAAALDRAWLSLRHGRRST